MTITTAWQGIIGSVTFGAGTDYPGIGGVRGAYGTPDVEATDLTFGGRDGTFGGLDRYPRRIIKLPFQVLGDDPADVETNIAALKAAWRRTTADVELQLRLAGSTTYSYFGRPRGLDDSRLGQVIGGTALLTGTFVCMDPAAYGATVTVAADSSSPVTLSNAGNATSYRCTLTVAGNGGTPVLTNPDDPDGDDITFASTLAGGQSYVIDLHTQTVTKSGVNCDADVAASSRWFGLYPGDNDIAFTGCASVAASFRPAWE